MALETGTFISDLVVTNPAHTDGLNNADAHMRLIKSTIKATFPNITGAVSLTQAQINGLATGGLTFGDGSVSAPSVTFGSDATAGFYHVSTGETGIAGQLVGNGATPPGALLDFATASAPTGWLTCDGQAVSRTTYAALFAAVGTTWGTGDGSTTFNVPDLRSRFRRHTDVGGLGVAGVVGNKQAPANLTHTHGVNGTTASENTAHTHTFSGSTGTESASHTHSYLSPFNEAGETGGGAFPADTGSGSGNTTGSESASHTHSFSGTTGSESANHQHSISITSGTGSADDTETRPWSATVLTCIKT